MLGVGNRPQLECKVVFPAEAAPMPVLSAAEGPPEAGRGSPVCNVSALHLA